ncbi:hypothetical protein JR316_0007340 [Psilocybe cubensis]|uniref:Uncharacterized protein n=1 Tax=Psilocybe cubensis TaxID=181762 RepID=A0ACB8H0L8_PSICU|nr:hypothetical protein JR316_0007340 [Psilocybe cubensis]KAH9480740.1 hypothetical protein JR316_0007340 [Psilocybe cubensis]
MSPSSNNLVQSSQSHRVPIPQAVLPSDEVKAEDIKHDILKEEQAENSSPHCSRYSQLLESDMPWFQEELSARARVNPSCLESARLLKMLSVLCPGSVPESQWERIFKGLPVDLGIFRSNLIRTTIDEQPSTPISTASDWCMAWSYASKAIAFAFPNRMAAQVGKYSP